MGKLRCGGLDKFYVFKRDDVKKYLLGDRQMQLQYAQIEIEAGRARDGRRTTTSGREYLVINTDEPYAGEIIEILKRNGHWG